MALTYKQQCVLRELTEAAGPLGAYALLDRLRDEGFYAPIQVYRALDRLTDRGLVHRLETLNAYVTCTPPTGDEDTANAFAICEMCGRVDQFNDQSLDRCLKRRMNHDGFASCSSTIEIRGICKTCSSQC
jgi:Fur family zinc uptake transcriptional regulator